MSQAAGELYNNIGSFELQLRQVTSAFASGPAICFHLACPSLDFRPGT
jgi:hypothetical protein